MSGRFARPCGDVHWGHPQWSAIGSRPVRTCPRFQPGASIAVLTIMRRRPIKMWLFTTRLSLNLFRIRALLRSDNFTSPRESAGAVLQGRPRNHAIRSIQQWNASCGQHATKSRRTFRKSSSWAHHFQHQCLYALRRRTGRRWFDHYGPLCWSGWCFNSGE
jgi:hypothetical protein